MSATLERQDDGAAPHRDVPFDPAAWLVAFTAAGGGYVVVPDGWLWLFIGECDDMPRFMAPLIGQPDRRDRLRDLITRQQAREV